MISYFFCGNCQELSTKKKISRNKVFMAERGKNLQFFPEIFICPRTGSEKKSEKLLGGKWVERKSGFKYRF